MPISESDPPKDFDAPTALPRTEDQAKRWQEENRSWWEAHPMRYDWHTVVGHSQFSPAFFAEIDRRFFSSAAEYLPPLITPFDRLIDFEALASKDVLEVGVGNGSHAQLLARHAKTFTGIDLTDYAVSSTGARLGGSGLKANVLRMDAERMTFPDATFDFVWSWGVIHHSSDTRRALREIRRVLKPGGTATVMVYYRSWWHYYVVGGLILGLVRGNLFSSGALHKNNQSFTDGALARFYSAGSWRAMAGDLLEVRETLVLGPKSDLVPLPAGRLKNSVLRAIPSGVARFLTRRCGMGTFLVSTMAKPLTPP